MNAFDRVKNSMRSDWKALLKARLNRNATVSYSQFGEDIYLISYLKGKSWEADHTLKIPPDGFYVDVGSYSPTECSNTYYFYKLGWRGINIDATPGVKECFDLVRPRDTNLNVAIDPEKSEITFYSWGTPCVFNTADEELARSRALELNQKPEQIRVACSTLVDILDAHVPGETKIDFMSVDVEGADLQVLKSNDWSKYRPEVLLVEDYAATPEELIASSIFKFLGERDYECYAWLRPSVVFKDVRAV